MNVKFLLEKIREHCKDMSKASKVCMHHAFTGRLCNRRRIAMNKVGIIEARRAVKIPWLRAIPEVKIGPAVVPRSKARRNTALASRSEVDSIDLMTIIAVVGNTIP